MNNNFNQKMNVKKSYNKPGIKMLTQCDIFGLYYFYQTNQPQYNCLLFLKKLPILAITYSYQ